MPIAADFRSILQQNNNDSTMGKIRTFRHPVQPLADDRISMLIAERGALGYGAYWMIIEALHREPSLQLPNTEIQLRKLAAHTGISLHDFSQLLQDLIEVYGLLALQADCLVSTVQYRRPPRREPQPATALVSLAPEKPAANEPYMAAGYKEAASTRSNAVVNKPAGKSDMPPREYIENGLRSRQPVPPIWRPAQGTG